MCHGKSWKVIVIRKVLKKLGFFREENSKNVPKMKDDFQEIGEI